ncbi:hypothetical protein BOTBODRAFT_168689 [Botryobasidium botryosum FD-172 SS1]|uniref:Uncharacterized protein n=1 Tax=Botryobasidium botryosum (strain FD-172 SS1) TaxID=930990 RepID=A0A067NCC9_BOTB1|nr:hypothetical protein BOTBODRAFT_168689 [Botryobasidium botryosum FD-172 SS1]
MPTVLSPSHPQYDKTAMRDRDAARKSIQGNGGRGASTSTTTVALAATRISSNSHNSSSNDKNRHKSSFHPSSTPQSPILSLLALHHRAYSSSPPALLYSPDRVTSSASFCSDATNALAPLVDVVNPHEDGSRYQGLALQGLHSPFAGPSEK